MDASRGKITLYHHPFTRAQASLWMLEEVGQPYDLVFMDLMTRANHDPKFRKLNPMGKLPVLVDGEVIVTESAAIGLYLADRYAMGTLAPRPDAPERGAYFRWSCFAPTVIEPGAAAKASEWKFEPTRVGWGTYETMLDTIEHAIGQGPWLLGEQFSMADVIFGGTLRFMVTFKMLEARPSFSAYIARLDQRPAYQAAVAKNAAVIEAHGLKRP